MSTLQEVLGEVEETTIEDEETTEKPDASDDASPAETVEEAKSEVETTEPEGVTETEEVEEAAPPAAKEVPLTALLDERDKRKQAQSELEGLKRQLEETREKPDFWEDPQSTVETLVNEKVGELETKFNQGYLNLSMHHSRLAHDDFDDAKEAFIKAAEENPALANAAVQAELPGEYIYKTGKEFMALSTYGDVDSAIEAAKREAVEEYIARQAEKDKGNAEKIAAVPTPITEESSVGDPSKPAEGGPEPLENIFVHNRG